MHLHSCDFCCRFLAVTRPIKYSRGGLNSTLRVRVSIIASWSISAAVASPIVFGINDTPSRSLTPFLCTFYNADFLLYSSVCSFYLPGSIVAFLYWRIFRVINARRIPYAAAEAGRRRPTPGSNHSFVASRPGSSSSFYGPRETSWDEEDMSLADFPAENRMADAASRQNYFAWIRNGFATMRALLKLPEILETTVASRPVQYQGSSGLETSQAAFVNIAPNSVLSRKSKFLHNKPLLQNFSQGASHSPQTSSLACEYILPHISCSLNLPEDPGECSLSSKNHSPVRINDLLLERCPVSSNKVPADPPSMSETCTLTDYTKKTHVSRKPALPHISDAAGHSAPDQLTAPCSEYRYNKSKTVQPRRNAAAFERRWKSVTTMGSAGSPKRFWVSPELRKISAIRKRYRKERKINKALAIVLGK